MKKILITLLLVANTVFGVDYVFKADVIANSFKGTGSDLTGLKAVNVTRATETYTTAAARVVVDADHERTILMNTAGGQQVTLPAASARADGFTVHVKNIHTSVPFVIARNGADTINGAANNITLYPGAAITLRRTLSTGWETVTEVKPARKRYYAVIRQTGTVAPVPQVIEDTIGGISWSYISPGVYRLTKTGAFPLTTTAAKGRINTPVGGSPGREAMTLVVTVDNITITTYDTSTGNAVNGLIGYGSWIEIEVP